MIWSCFIFFLTLVPTWSQRYPYVSLWSGHRIRLWVSSQTSVHEHQVGQECPSLLHLVLTRPGKEPVVHPGLDVKEGSELRLGPDPSAPDLYICNGFHQLWSSGQSFDLPLKTRQWFRNCFPPTFISWSKLKSSQQKNFNTKQYYGRRNSREVTRLQTSSVWHSFLLHKMGNSILLCYFGIRSA